MIWMARVRKYLAMAGGYWNKHLPICGDQAIKRLFRTGTSAWSKIQYLKFQFNLCWATTFQKINEKEIKTF